MPDTRNEGYTRRLETKTSQRWKQILDVQAPYRRNLRRQRLGRTIDIGCGIGRNLAALDPGSIGVDHNPTSVRVAREAGHQAFTVEEWSSSKHRRIESFDALLLAHVIEHLDPADGEALVREYLPMLRPGGKLLFICPQERGFSSDATHVRWTTGDDLVGLAAALGMQPERWRSFPFPRAAGKVFTYNEFQLLAHKR